MISAEKNLLESLLETNTVTFQTDLKCRDWMFGYYLTSALRRLSTAKRMLDAKGAAFDDFEYVEQHHLFGISHPPQKTLDDPSRNLGGAHDRVEAPARSRDCRAGHLKPLPAVNRSCFPATGSERDQLADSGDSVNTSRPKNSRIS